MSERSSGTNTGAAPLPALRVQPSLRTRAQAPLESGPSPPPRPLGRDHPAKQQCDRNYSDARFTSTDRHKSGHTHVTHEFKDFELVADVEVVGGPVEDQDTCLLHECARD